jgi:hypothetical protein
MPEVRIYDSQGQPVGERGGQVNERIRDFFFDGVRFTFDSSGGRIEIVCFLRARESEASRSEQYYAVFETRNRHAGNFGEAVKERVEDDLGLILETSTEDTTIFELLRAGEQPSHPLPDNDLDDILDVVGNGEDDLLGIDESAQPSLGGDPAKLGAGSYRDAFGLCREVISRRPTNARYAIADNAASSRLQHFDVVIEHGSYAGIELFEETDEVIEEMRERRRRRHQSAPIGQEDSSSGLDLKLIGSGAVFIIGIILLGTFGLCMVVQLNIPVVGGFFGCGGGGPVLENVTATAEWNGNGTAIDVSGEVNASSGNISENNAMFNFTIHPANGSQSEPLISGSKNTSIGKNNTFVFSIPVDNEGSLNSTNGNYSMNLTYKGKNESATIEPLSDNASDEAPQPTPTPGGTPTPEPTATDTTSPQITNFTATNPSEQNVKVTVSSNETLENITVSITGPENATLTIDDFEETQSNRYVATYTGSSDGEYTVRLSRAIDSAGNEGTQTEPASVDVDTTVSEVVEFTATNTPDQQIEIALKVKERMDVIRMNITGGSNTTELTRADFAENIDGGNVTYTTEVSKAPGETYTVGLDGLGDEAGNVRDFVQEETVEIPNSGS